MSDFKLLEGDCREVLKSLPDNSVDAVVTDPPYELGFMGKSWDASGIAYDKTMWAEVFRVLKPGGHVLSFGGSRTYHRMACAIEDAGFEVRDQIMWVYGSGFPKSHNISKAIDKANGVEREDKFEGAFSRFAGPTGNKKCDKCGKWLVSGSPCECPRPQDEAKSPEAKQWEGWGTALKPAHEPIVLARKPFDGAVAENVLKWGPGGLNIDGCRVGFVSDADRKESLVKNQHADFNSKMGGNQIYGDYSMLKPQNYSPQGRFPANLMHDGSQEVLDLFPESKGGHWSYKQAKDGGLYEHGLKDLEDGGSDKQGGSAARFFYCPKATKKDRDEGCDELETKEKPAHMRTGNGTGDTSMTDGFQATQRKNTHPTVKPTELMRYLCRLITPPGGTVLDPFNGSGSTGKAALKEGFNYIGIEKEAEYLRIAEARIRSAL